LILFLQFRLASFGFRDTWHICYSLPPPLTADQLSVNTSHRLIGMI